MLVELRDLPQRRICIQAAPDVVGSAFGRPTAAELQELFESLREGLVALAGQSGIDRQTVRSAIDVGCPEYIVPPGSVSATAILGPGEVTAPSEYALRIYIPPFPVAQRLLGYSTAEWTVWDMTCAAGSCSRTSTVVYIYPNVVYIYPTSAEGREAAYQALAGVFDMLERHPATLHGQ